MPTDFVIKGCHHDIVEKKDGAYLRIIIPYNLFLLCIINNKFIAKITGIIFGNYV